MELNPAYDSLRKLFGVGESDALLALRKPTPSSKDLPDEKAREYVQIAIRILAETKDNQNVRETVFKLQGLRLLVLERVFKARKLPLGPGMQGWLGQVSASIRAALLKEGLRVD